MSFPPPTSLFSFPNNTMLGALNGSLAGSPLQDLLSTWLDLDLKTAAAILTILGAIGAAGQSLAGLALQLYWWVTRFFTASVSIAGSDRLNREVLNWLAANVLLRQGTRILTAGSEQLLSDASSFRRAAMHWDDDVSAVHHDRRGPIQYLPTFGVIWFVHDRNVFLVKRVRSGRSSRSSYVSSVYSSAFSSHQPDEYSGAPDGSEPLVVLCLGRSVAPIKRFLETCRTFAEEQRAEFVSIRSCRGNDLVYNRWNSLALRPARPLETVHFDEAVKADLVADIRSYLDPETRRFYNARGIPYRRGYLLHGPPGTGKTSLSLALATLFALELYMVHIPSVINDTQLDALFSTLPPQCIVLLEDVDAVRARKHRRHHWAGGHAVEESDEEDEDDMNNSAARRRRHHGSRCTLSGLLNVLDGVASHEGRIVLMTTNFADSLDGALVRPGRIDRSIFLGNISPRSAELMFERMFGGEEEKEKENLAELAALFGSAVPEDTFSPAQLQGYLLTHRGAPKRAVEGAAKWVAEERGRMEAAEQREKLAEERARRKRRERRAKVLAEAGEKVQVDKEGAGGDGKKGVEREAEQ